MKKSTGILLALSALLGGIVAGVIIAPIKRGIYVGCNNGNRYYNEDEDLGDYHLADDDDEEWMSSGTESNKDDLPF